MPSRDFKRILLKLSGEALMGDQQFGIETDTVTRVAEEIRLAKEAGYELCVVVGGGNIFRGLAASEQGFDRASADYMGMLATVEKGRIVIFAAGTGNPFFTTDTAAALRAAEMQCDALFKGTSVDGVYTADPKKDRAAERYETLAFDKVLSDNLKVMDASAVAVCRENHLPIVVFNIREHGNLARVLAGEGTSTIVQ